MAAGSGTPIDLKNTRLYIRDGYSNAGAVNNESGYTAGATTMTVDSVTGIIATGTTFTVAGDDTIYTVLSHTETSGNTTSITFAPALGGTVADNAVLTFGPHQIEVRIGEGNLTYEVQKERQYRKSGGRIDYVRDGDDIQMPVNFDFVWDHIIGSTDDPITIEEALYQTGNAIGWVSSDPDVCQPYAVDLVLIYTPNCDVEEMETIIFPKFRYENLNHNLRDGTVACRGACNAVRPTVTRGAAA